MKKNISIYTDGACSGNPGRGGYGIVMKLDGTNYTKEFSGGYKKTTNNRMELMAVIFALENITLENQTVKIFTDSKYVCEAVEKKWLDSWQKINFKNKKNIDLWQRYLSVAKNHDIKFYWIKGHNGHPENERADQLAVLASKGENLLEDKEYLENSTTALPL